MKAQREFGASDRPGARAGRSAQLRRAAHAGGPTSLSVIVPVRNRAHLVGHCLESLVRAAQVVVRRGVTVEVLVTNDASTDDTGDVVDRVAAAAPIPIRQLRFETRQGPARARNAALEAATGELIVFVDSDVIVPERFFEAHLAAYRHDRSVYVVGVLVFVSNVEEALKQPGPTLWDFSSASMGTANASVLREHLEAVGYFDPGFRGMGWEDIDLGRRLKKFGLKRLQPPDTIAYHVEAPIENERQLQARFEKEQERGISAVYFMRKYPGWRGRLTAQDTMFHRFLNWLFRMGGLVSEHNVLDWVRWARRYGLTALERMWFAGVFTHVHLRSLTAAKRLQLSS